MLFLGVFIYAILAMVTSREIVIPHIMSSSINGNIAGDPYYYHTLALRKAGEIRAKGIWEFELRPEGQGPAGVASLLYLIWENPYSMVLANAVLHGVAVVMMALILMRWFSRRTSIIATLPLAISPYMIFWFSQINKDSFVLCGALLFVYGLLNFLTPKEKRLSYKNELLSLLVIVAGISLTWFVRPYINQILLPITSVFLLVGLLSRIKYSRDGEKWLGFFMCGTLVLICLTMMGKGGASGATIESFAHYTFQQSHGQSHGDNQSDSSAKCLASIDERNWRNEQFLPDFVNKKLKALMGQRCLMFTMLQTQNNAATLYSFVDVNTFPSGSAEALAYLPRAALLGIFSPLPAHWGYIFNHGPSMFYTITPVEAILLYIGVSSLLFWAISKHVWSALIPIALSVTVMTIYGMATPFIGALYRYRYPWWILMICMGLAAIITVSSRFMNYWQDTKLESRS